jgi:hypothetical protein
MDNLTNTILTKVTDLVQTSGISANVADRLLRYILLKDNASAAFCKPTINCTACRKGKKMCRCCIPPRTQACYLVVFLNC